MNQPSKFLVYLFLAVSSLQCFGEMTEPESVDPDIVDVLVAGITDEGVTAVHSRYPQKGEYVKRLTRTGESIYSHPEMLTSWPLFQTHDLGRLIRGACHDYFFLTYGNFGERTNYTFIEGGEYILFLKPSMDEEGNITTDKIDVDLFYDVSKFTFLSYDTLFDLHRINGKSGVIGLSVIQGKIDPMHVPNEGSELVEDLSLISDFFHSLSNDAELPYLFSQLNSKYGVQVAIEIFGAPENLGVVSRSEEPVVEAAPAPVVEEVAEVIEELTAPELAVEEPAEVAVAEPIEEPAEKSSNWWLWLLGLLLFVGGVVAVRRKS